MHVYSYEELVAEVQRKERWAKFGVALQGVGAAMSAANAVHSHDGDVLRQYLWRVFRCSERNLFRIHYRRIFRDDLRRWSRVCGSAVRERSNRGELCCHTGARATGARSTPTSILKDNTVLPGEWVGGIVVLDAPTKARDGSATYRIDIQLSGEVHSTCTCKLFACKIYAVCGSRLCGSPRLGRPALDALERDLHAEAVQGRDRDGKCGRLA